MNFKIAALHLALGCALVQGAYAVPAEQFFSSGEWTSVQENDGPVDDVNGLGTSEVSWGIPFGDDNNGQSSYVFSGRDPGAAPLDGTEFELGDFTHNNFTIEVPASITGASLEVTLNFASGGGEQMFSLFFSHLETPNDDDPCAAGGVQPCPDLVGIPDATGSALIALGDDDYLLNITGFSQDGGVTTTPNFLTLEGQSNTATLFAQLELVPPQEVPEPPMLALMGLMALFGWGMQLKSRTAKT